MECPWYLPVKEAAEVAGISEKQLRDFVNSNDAPARLMSGKTVRLNMRKLRDYLEAREL
jgi:excisionase family DNA binding protein